MPSHTSAEPLSPMTRTRRRTVCHSYVLVKADLMFSIIIVYLAFCFEELEEYADAVRHFEVCIVVC